ncbi:MAG: hypothetical protein QW451_02235 [Candidatus Aenigmatarchaeota archaeon]
MGVRIERLDPPGIYTEEDILRLRFVEYSLKEHDSLKMEAASEGEEEIGGLEISGKGYKREVKASGISGRRSFTYSEATAFNISERKREVIKKFSQPPEIKNSRIYLDGENYVIEVDFVRLGKNRRLKIVTPSLALEYVEKLLEEKMTEACALIPYSDVVVEKLKEYVKNLISNKI